MTKPGALALIFMLALSAGTVGVRALDLKGADDLKGLTRDVISACPGASGTLTFVAGGSVAGEGALIANFSNGWGTAANQQQIAPMSRFLTGSPTLGGICGNDASRAQGIEFAADDLGLWFSQGRQANCDPGSLTDACTGYTNGGLSFSRTLSTASCNLTITSWKDVARLLYFGLAPSAFPLPNTPVDPNSEVSPAAVARRDCRNPCRDELRNHFGELFQNDCAGSGDCTRLQHAFRLDENSGSTDFFREALGVEGSASFGNKGFPFCNEHVPRVTINLPSVAIPASCTPNTATGCASGYVCNASGTSCARPYNGCLTATDCSSGSACDRGQGQCVKTCTSDTDCSAIGGRCVVMPADHGLPQAKVCAKAVDACDDNADCHNGFICDLNANGGTCMPPCTPSAAGVCVAGTCTANSECGGGGTCSFGTCTAGSCTANSQCGLLPSTGQCNAPDTACAAYLPGGECNLDRLGCTRAYGTICPTAGLIGATADATATIPSWTGTVAGRPGIVRSVHPRGTVSFENQQDNDPLRWKAAGSFSFNLGGIPSVDPAEQVASMCGDLGLVLPISEPPTSGVADPNVFPTTLCRRGVFGFGVTTTVQTFPARYLLCPNGDASFASVWNPLTRTSTGGIANCLHPLNGDFRCLNGSNNKPAARFSAPVYCALPGAPGDCTSSGSCPATYSCVDSAGGGLCKIPGSADCRCAKPGVASGPCGAGVCAASSDLCVSVPLPAYNTPTDARAYNLHLFQSNSTLHAGQPYTYNAGAEPPTATAPYLEPSILQTVTSAFYRIHSTRTLNSGGDALCPGKPAPEGGGCCLLDSNTTQSGCLVAASPCSMSFAGLPAGTVALTTGTSATTQRIAFATGLNTSAGPLVSPNGPNGCVPPGPVPLLQYPLAHNLFVNTTAGFATAPSNDPQLALARCFSGGVLVGTTTIQQLIAANGFVNLTAYPCCRDFDESGTCAQSPNTNACVSNPVGIPNTACPF